MIDGCHEVTKQKTREDLLGRRSVQLLHLPDDILLQILQSLPLSGWLADLPRVCQKFARLLGYSDSRLSSLEFASYLGRQPLDDSALTPAVLDVLPSTLTHLELQCDWIDRQWKWKRRPHSIQGLPMDNQTDFHSAQDVAPHLAYLRRLSNLQRLALPVYSTLDDTHLEELALQALQDLHIEFRQELSGSQVLAHKASLSQLASLTKVSLAGSNVTHFHGAAQLPQLESLSIARAARLSLLDFQHPAAIKFFRLCDVQLTEDSVAMLHTLRTLKSLETLILRSVSFISGSSPLQFASLLELSTLRLLDVSQCACMSYHIRHPEESLHSSLTRLRFAKAAAGDQEGTIPGLAQLYCLAELNLMSPKIVAPYVVPAAIGALANLRVLDVYKSSNHHGPACAIDISAFASLGPTIEQITVTTLGNVELLIKCSLRRLAAQPRLRSVSMNDVLQLSSISVSSAADSWLHCAAFLHALLERPHKGLGPVVLSPDLTEY
ncbi:hypothetical protein WJX74_004215 [Apatococcus lobatus]|uniref:F-box domain-containing protein n=1 Tax=Apatococcus lobatus TaxID=904363 RepID=A0AAW1RBP7_9CHLO